VSPLYLELLARACQRNMSTKLAIQPISRTNSSRSTSMHINIPSIVWYFTWWDTTTTGARWRSNSMMTGSSLRVIMKLQLFYSDEGAVNLSRFV
jgi:hypothetical protein